MQMCVDMTCSAGSHKSHTIARNKTVQLCAETDPSVGFGGNDQWLQYINAMPLAFISQTLLSQIASGRLQGQGLERASVAQGSQIESVSQNPSKPCHMTSATSMFSSAR